MKVLLRLVLLICSFHVVVVTGYWRGAGGDQPGSGSAAAIDDAEKVDTQAPIKDDSHEDSVDFDDCDPNWETEQAKYIGARNSMWSNPDCYDFTLYRGCFCPSTFRGPHQVSIRDGELVAPTSPSDVPDMNELFDLVNDKCFENCPSRGAFYCNVTYAPEGYIEQIDVNERSYVSDDEFVYIISNFTFC